MSEGHVNYRDLLEFVENLVHGNVEPRAPELIQRLQPYKRVFLNLLQHKVHALKSWNSECSRRPPRYAL